MPLILTNFIFQLSICGGDLNYSITLFQLETDINCRMSWALDITEGLCPENVCTRGTPSEDVAAEQLIVLVNDHCMSVVNDV